MLQRAKSWLKGLEGSLDADSGSLDPESRPKAEAKGIEHQRAQHHPPAPVRGPTGGPQLLLLARTGPPAGRGRASRGRARPAAPQPAGRALRAPRRARSAPSRPRREALRVGAAHARARARAPLAPLRTPAHVRAAAARPRRARPRARPPPRPRRARAARSRRRRRAPTPTRPRARPPPRPPQAPPSGSSRSMDPKEFFTDYGEATRYSIKEVIGKGSYGVVCSAVDNYTGEKVRARRRLGRRGRGAGGPGGSGARQEGPAGVWEARGPRRGRRELLGGMRPAAGVGGAAAGSGAALGSYAAAPRRRRRRRRQRCGVLLAGGSQQRARGVRKQRRQQSVAAGAAPPAGGALLTPNRPCPPPAQTQPRWRSRRSTMCLSTCRTPPASCGRSSCCGC
jgi:hypothetical protein